MIGVVACQCGSSETLARDFLKKTGYPDWLNIPIHKGKEKSLAFLNQLPPSQDKELLVSFIKGAGRWVVIVGFDGNTVKWANIVHNPIKSKIEAEFIIKNFSDLL